MAGKTVRKIVSDLLVFLILIGIVVVIGECVDRSLERKIDYDAIIARCVPFISNNTAIAATFGTPTNIIHQNEGGGFTWSAQDVTGADTFWVYGTKSNGMIKICWRDKKQEGFEVLKISMPEAWQNNSVIWTRGDP